MTTEIAVRAATLPEKMQYAEALAFSGMLPEQYRKQPANVLWAVEYGETIGITPMAAITGVHMIEGKPTASAALISGLVRRAGHKLRSGYDPKTRTGWAEIVRCDDPDFTFRSEWDLDRAVEAELVQVGPKGELIAKDSKGRSKPWKKFYPSMTKARAITEVARDACEEVLFGLHYTPEELGADTDDEGNLVVCAARGAVVAQADDPWQTPAPAPAASAAAPVPAQEAEYAEVVGENAEPATEWNTATGQPLPPPPPLIPTVTKDDLDEIARLLKAKRGATNGDRKQHIEQLVRRPVPDPWKLSAAEGRSIIETLTGEDDFTPPATETAPASPGTPDNPVIGRADHRQMQALFKTAGITDRDEQHAFIQRVLRLDAPLESRNNITKDQFKAIRHALSTGEVPTAPEPPGPNAMGEGISEFDALDQMILDVTSDEARDEVEQAITVELGRGTITATGAGVLRRRLADHVAQAKAGAAS